ncbi:hypothetical protein EJV47_03370 [Hymenobacter gummosus]|uniref:STAS/SEC14 domain-containing protein n=1 Tax=Hymenobacter gummosus TaxID=1776032 RepID=A0A431U6K4_9BACT|nr:hypothetical protein [Hymenobacter gummosus]RTQ52082.1 hypothetical protein EJV47_03370 [Hymenobacter gummosus]
MSVLLAHPFLHVHLHPGPVPVLETEWLGFAGSADFRAALTQAVDAARLHGGRGWVADDRRLGPVRPVDMDWVADWLLPTLDALGIRRFALVESEESLNRFLINNMYQTVTPELPQMEFQAFPNLAEARAWAAEQDQELEASS